ncbi:MAG: tetratricopeptide repeat protein [Armatimonadota bacterium]
MGLTNRNILFAGALTAALSGVLLSGCTQTTEAPSTTASAPVESAPPMAVNASAAKDEGHEGHSHAGEPAGAHAGESAGGATSPGGMPPGPANAGGVPPMAGGGNAPFAGGMGGDPNAPLSASPELDKKIADADKGTDKKAISAAYTERGAARMYDEKAGAKIKYKAALEDFRKALAADPTNKDAKASKDTIESIYTSMGRPVPK